VCSPRKGFQLDLGYERWYQQTSVYGKPDDENHVILWTSICLYILPACDGLTVDGQTDRQKDRLTNACA